MAPKAADKLTDAQKKKVKQANKAKANPGKAEEKAKTNLKRRIGRGQIVDPDAVIKKNDAIVEDTSTTATSEPKKVVKRTDAEKAERQRLKVLAIEKSILEKQQEKEKRRMQDLLQDKCVTEDTITS